MSDTLFPAKPLLDVMVTAYRPCFRFGTCPEARWAPSEGHAPRGFLGATGDLSEVTLIMVFAEPGNPHADESHGDGTDPLATMASCLRHAYASFARGTDLFHRNCRWFIDQVFPGLTFGEQLRRVWLTEGRLCSFAQELGGKRSRSCADHYLDRQLSLMLHATVVAFGGKAAGYLKGLRKEFVEAYALAPPGANHLPAKPSWERAIAKVRANAVRG